MEYNPVIDAEELRKHYRRTLTLDRVMLTAHSHRAWPDRIASGQLDALDLAFELADRKWAKIFGEVIPEFQRLVAQRIGCSRPDLIAQGENCHELVTRVLSCFPWDSHTRIVTTDAEFHSMKRQLYRLEEEGVEVEYVATAEKQGLTGRITDAVRPGTDIVAVSTVFFNDGYVLQNVKEIVEKARRVGAIVLLDAYHQFNVRRMDLDALGSDVFMTAAGYKYAGAGEGAAWLKVPDNCNLRPRITGWFADFAALEREFYPKPVEYGPGAQRFAGATRDLSGICRQIEVFRFMDELGLTVDVLEANNLHQTDYMIHLYDSFGLRKKGVSLASSRNDRERGPFLALDLGSVERAGHVQETLMEKHRVWTDTRGRIVRLGPAPYITKSDIEFAMTKLSEVLDG